MTFVSYTENPLSKEDIKHTWKHGLVAVKVIHDISILIAFNEKSFQKVILLRFIEKKFHYVYYNELYDQ